jgi:hypothetical protein
MNEAESAFKIMLSRLGVEDNFARLGIKEIGLLGS